jgi:hypothetical protein
MYDLLAKRTIKSEMKLSPGARSFSTHLNRNQLHDFYFISHPKATELISSTSPYSSWNKNVGF